MDLGASLYVGLLSLFALLVSKFARVSDVPIGTAWAGRDAPETADMLGYFVNTLVLRCTIEAKTVHGLIKDVPDVALAALSNTLVPYQQHLKVHRFQDQGSPCFLCSKRLFLIWR